MNTYRPYVHLVRARGKDYAYYRRGGVRIRIPGDIGSDEWQREYDRIHADFEAAAAGRPTQPEIVPGSIEALWLAYQNSHDWRRLVRGTQDGYERVMRPIVAEWGHNPLGLLNRAWYQERIDEVAATPGKANLLLAVLRLVLNWGIARDWTDENPAKLVKPVKYEKAKHRVWRQPEIDAMTAPDSPVRIPVLLALYTGQRLGDVLAMRWDQVDDDLIRVKQHKTKTELVIPIHPVVAEALAAAPRTADTIATRADGRSWKYDRFKHAFIKERRRRELPEDLHFHGLRHLAASRLAEAGSSDAEIAAITGHKSNVMVRRYTAGARQERLARSAMSRISKGSDG